MQLPSDRLRHAGATPDELAQLQAEHDTASDPAKESRLKHLAGIAEQDIREWLQALRDRGHFGTQREAETPEPEPAAKESTEPKAKPAPKTEPGDPAK